MLISCVAYQDGTKIGDITAAQIGDYLHRLHCFVWAALQEPSAAELAEMRTAFALHPLAVEDALVGPQRPKVDEYGDSLFAVLHLVEPTSGEYRVGELAVFAGPNFIVTVRSRAQKGLAEVRARCEREPQLLRQGPGFVLYAVIDAVVDRYFPILDTLEDELDGIEQRIFAPQGAPRDNIEALYALKQRLMVMKHAVAPLLEGVSNLTGGRVPALCVDTTEYFRDIYDHLLRLNQTADSVRDTIATAISVNLSFITLQENETMKRLAAFYAFLSIATVVARMLRHNF